LSTARRLRLSTIIFIALLGLLVSACYGIAPPGPQTVTNAAPVVTPAAASAPYTIIPGKIRELPVGDSNAGMMRPAVDSAGNVWFGEMNYGYLAELNSNTGTFHHFTPPHNLEGIMGIAIDRLGNVWFAEQYANYIGRFTPSTRTFKIYPLPPYRGHTAGPQDLLFDNAGNLWFTELLGNAIGRLNPTTGQIHIYPIPTANLLPYGLTLGHDGTIWFSSLASGKIGRLDPATGAVRLYTLPQPTPAMELTTTPDGSIWFAGYQSGILGQINPQTGQITTSIPPSPLGLRSGLYGLISDAQGNLWFTYIGNNAIGKFIPANGHYILYQIPIPDSGPFGLAFSRQGTIVFTESAASANSIGVLTP
jgi:virginiamycin B lyase